MKNTHFNFLEPKLILTCRLWQIFENLQPANVDIPDVVIKGCN